MTHQRREAGDPRQAEPVQLFTERFLNEAPLDPDLTTPYAVAWFATRPLGARQLNLIYRELTKYLSAAPLPNARASGIETNGLKRPPQAVSSRTENPLKQYQATRNLDYTPPNRLEALYSQPALLGTLVLAEILHATEASSFAEDSTRSDQHKINASNGALAILIETNLFGEQSVKTRQAIADISANAIQEHARQHARRAANARHEKTNPLKQKAIELFFELEAKRHHSSMLDGARRVLPLLREYAGDDFSELIRASDPLDTVYRWVQRSDRVREEYRK